jgi:hypothetical protein
MADEQNMHEFFENMLKQIEENPPEDKNGGHEALLKDLGTILGEALDYEYDDFRNKHYAMPKMALIQKLEELINNTKQGKYDN